MIKRQEFINNVSQFRVGKSSMILSEEAAPAKPEELNPGLSSSGTQVAGLGSGLTGIFKKLLSRNSNEVMDAADSKREALPTMSLDEAEVLAEKYMGSKYFDKPIDDENLGLIFNNIESSEDLQRLTGIAGSGAEKPKAQPFDELAEGSEDPEQIRGILTGTQEGLHTPKQQLGMRRLTVSIGESAVELANKITAGDHTPKTLLEFQQAYSRYDAVLKMSKNNATETARALNQQKILAQTLQNNNLREMTSALNLYGGTPEGTTIRRVAELITKGVEKGGKPADEMEKALNKKLHLYTRGAVELWKNNILSGLGTHTTNVLSVAVANTWENAVIHPMQVGIGAIRTMGKEGEVDRAYASEIVYKAAGSYVGLKSSMSMFFKAFASGESKFGSAGKMEDTGAVRQIARDVTGGSKIGDAWANASTLSFRLLLAEDDAMRGVVFTSELYALTAREGRMKGLTGKDLLAYVDDNLENPSDVIYEGAIKEAARKTFTEGELKGIIGSMARYTRQMTNDMPGLQFLIPFVNTPANLLQYALDTSALAAFNPRLWKEVKQGGAAGDMALAKIVSGTAMTMGIWQAYEAGIISGSGPEDYAARKQLEKEGWKPNAIKDPSDKFYQVRRMEPFALSMNLVANFMDRAKYAATEEAAKAHFSNAMLIASETAFDSSWIKNFSDFTHAIGDQKKWDTFQSGYIASLVPYSGALRTVEQIQDPIAARTSDDKKTRKAWWELAKETAMANLPGFSRFLRPARYWDGTVIIPTQGNFSFASSPIKEGIVGEGDIVNRELIRNGVTAKEPDSVISIGRTSFSLLDLAGGRDYLYDAYLVKVGQARRELTDKLVNSSQYEKLTEGPKGGRFVTLQKVLSKAKLKGLVDFLKDDMTFILDADPTTFSVAEKMFMGDPVSFVQGLIKETEQYGMDVSGPLEPARSPIELPVEQTHIPKF